MKKLIVISILAVFLWFKVIKGLIMNWKISNTIKNEAQFEAAKEEKEVIEAKINNHTATISEVKHWKDLTESLQYACYGITSRLDIEGVCLIISTLYAGNANPELLYKFLMEICAVESALGTAIYSVNRGYGYGLFQFDKIAFDDVKVLIKNKHSETFLFICQRDINKVEYGDLRTEALVACFFARTFLKYRIPQAVSSDINERARQWKTYYNTVKGKGTVEKYLSASKMV